MESRVHKFKHIKPLVEFNGRIVMIGCGVVGRATLPLLVKLVKMDFSNMVIIDMVDISSHIRHYIKHYGIKFVNKKVTKENHKKLLDKYLKRGDFLLDLAYDIYTYDLLKYCKSRGVLYLNTSVEEYDPYGLGHSKAQDYTLYHRNQEIRKLAASNQTDTTGQGPTAILDSGANPGFVSALVKKGLVDITKKLLKSSKLSKDTKKTLKGYIKNNHFNLLARALGLKTIHISERDTQISNMPKKPGQFVNTWSIPGFIEEGAAPAELGWGTHEKKLPLHARMHTSGEKNQICIDVRGCTKEMITWIKSGPIVGMLIRHGEAYSISSRLSVYPDDKVHPRSYVHDPLRHKDTKGKCLYRPTVHYVYLPCDNGLASIHECAQNGFQSSLDKHRIMYNDIISGRDELGVTLYGDFGIWWIGSLLDINEARKMVDPEINDISATSLQVGGGVISGIIYAMRHPNAGICFIDDCDYKEIYDVGKLVWGPMYSGPLNLTKEEKKKIKGYQFANFELHGIHPRGPSSKY